MPKSLNDILKGVNKSKTTALTTGDNPGVDYAAKMKDTRDFVAQHSVEKHADRVGNEDDVYAGSKIKKAEMKRHGHEPKPKDIKVYNKSQQVGQPENVKEEAKCNMTEAGKMCEVHGNKACPKEDDESAEDKEPRYTGKKKSGKQLITDKKLQEKLTKSTSAGEVISDFINSDDPKFKGKSKEERKRMALGAYYGMHPEKSKKVNEALSDQRSSKPTSSDKAREKIFAAMQKKKEEKMKEEAAATETPITFPATNSREGFRI